ncbi:MAG: nickel pincer cofactor biosynthesis protein LarC [Myxococcota bacterium]
MTRALYLDCYAGISGNMFLAALLDAGLDESAWREALGRLPVEGVDVRLERVHKRGIAALHASVTHPEQHAHRHLEDVLRVLRDATLEGAVYARAERIFTRLAEAEAEVHGTTVDHVHFHEVGAIDAIVDVMSAAFLLELADVERVICSPVRTGFGTVRCEHGLMPVPAPATALLLRGVPTYAGDVAGEFTTPTGAAILAASVDEFRPQPLLRTEHLGYGAGSREAPFPNCVRAAIGVLEGVPAQADVPWHAESLLEVETHVDDMTGEDLGFLVERLLAGPAVDVLVVPALGKKGRPAQVVRALCHPVDERALLSLLFQHSTTLGARVRLERRVFLPREQVVLPTPDGEVRAKRTADGRVRPEYDDVAAQARAGGPSLAARRAALQRGEKGS